jgi:hypothetical protein
MSSVAARLRGIAFIFWHARHMLYHLLLGLAWMWFCAKYLQIHGNHFLWFALIGSVIPDAEHFIYFFTYGKRDAYTQEIARFIRNGDWRILTVFIEKGHKYNTQLRYHNIYTILLLVIGTWVSYLFHLNGWVIFLGAMITHYCFDIVDDLSMLGHLNPNWYRWGRGKKHTLSLHAWKTLEKTVNKISK